MARRGKEQQMDVLETILGRIAGCQEQREEFLRQGKWL
jgi:hypothetical protein